MPDASNIPGTARFPISSTGASIAAGGCKPVAEAIRPAAPASATGLHTGAVNVRSNGGCSPSGAAGGQIQHPLVPTLVAAGVGEVHPRRWIEVGRWIERAVRDVPHASRKARKRATRARTGDGLVVNARLRVRVHDVDQVEVLLLQ